MKLYYKSEKYRLYNLRKATRALERKSKAGSEIARKSVYAGRSGYAESEVLPAPSVFSVLNNYDESMEFLNKVDATAWHGRKAFVDLASVKKLTPDAVLYLLSCIDRVQLATKERKIKGNAPSDQYCRKVFLKSGFYKFVTSQYSHEEDLDILSIRTNELISSSDAGAVLAYVRAKFKIERNAMTRATYATIMEAMNNVREHAYAGVNNKRWWLMALHNEECESIHFALLDNGRGIPATIRKKIPDYFVGNDGGLIRSSFSEEGRSETRLPYRGKGLPKIKALLDQGLIRNLRVISRNGYYLADTNECRNFTKEFRGTLLSWDFIKEECHD